MGSLLLLIYFIHHIASSMQADHVIQAVAQDVERCLQRVFPTDDVTTSDVEAPPRETRPDPASVSVSTDRIGYLQGIDEEGLMATARQHDLHIRVLRRPGHYVGWGSRLALVSARHGLDDDVERIIRKAFIVGGSRTSEQDPEFGIHQLVEIALRALSPGINDPFTAMTCVDHLAGILSSIAGVPERPPTRWDERGEARLLLDPIDFAGVLDAAFNQIRQCSTGTASVSIRLLEGLQIIAGATRDPDRLADIQRHGSMVYDANVDLLARGDREALEERHAALLRESNPDGQSRP